MYYLAKVVKVIDGSTLDVNLDLGFGIHLNTRLRLADIDVPKFWEAKTLAEKRHGEQAKSFVTKS